MFPYIYPLCGTLFLIRILTLFLNSYVLAETYGEEEESILATAQLWKNQGKRLAGYIGPQVSLFSQYSNEFILLSFGNLFLNQRE